MTDKVIRSVTDYCRRCGTLTSEGAHTRFYCPRCHQVTCGMKRQGQFIVLPHYTKDNPEARTSTKPCLGGSVDPELDRAP